MVSEAERKQWQQQATEITVDELKQFGTTVIIAPHQDDESLGCGGTVSLLRKAGLPVHVIFVSDGTLSHPNSKKYPAEKLRELRETEALNAMQILDIPAANASFMRIKDRSVPNPGDADFDNAVERMAQELARIKPETILVTWGKDPHPDHRASRKILNAAINKLDWKPRVLQYLIWIWELGKQEDLPDKQSIKLFWIDVKSVAQTKKKAIYSHVSQVTRLIDDDPEGFMLSPEILAHFDYDNELFIESISSNF